MTKRSEAAIIADIARTYSGLSPENLHQDGERSPSRSRAEGRRLETHLRGLFKELGRELDEVAAYEAVRHFNAQHDAAMNAKPTVTKDELRRFYAFANFRHEHTHPFPVDCVICVHQGLLLRVGDVARAALGIDFRVKA